MIISLIGFMAAGKTTMARELSAKVGAPMIDTDAYIEEREGKTISEIFAAVGEPGFRKIEEECLEDILEEHISEHPETLEDMHRCTLVLSLGRTAATSPCATSSTASTASANRSMRRWPALPSEQLLT